MPKVYSLQNLIYKKRANLNKNEEKKEEIQKKNIKRMPNNAWIHIHFRHYLRAREREFIITIKGQNQVQEREKVVILLQASN